MKTYEDCLKNIKTYSVTIKQLKKAYKNILDTKNSGYRTIFLGYDNDKKEIVLSCGSGRLISIDIDGYINFDYYAYNCQTLLK